MSGTDELVGGARNGQDPVTGIRSPRATPARSRQGTTGSSAQAWVLVGGSSALAGLPWLVSRLRPSRRPPSRSERLAQSSRAVGAASLVVGGRAVKKLAEVAEPAGERAGDLARRSAYAGAEVAQRAAAVAAPAVLSAAEAATREGRRAGALAAHGATGLATSAREVSAQAAHGATELATSARELSAQAAHAGHVVTSTLVELPETVAGTVAEQVDDLQRGWRRLTLRVTLAVAAGVGYVLGARAGRERYDDITAAAREVTQRPEVQQVLGRFQGARRDMT